MVFPDNRGMLSGPKALLFLSCLIVVFSSFRVNSVVLIFSASYIVISGRVLFSEIFGSFPSKLLKCSEQLEILSSLDPPLSLFEDLLRLPDISSIVLQVAWCFLLCGGAVCLRFCHLCKSSSADKYASSRSF